jgi:hypothetical protein
LFGLRWCFDPICQKEWWFLVCWLLGIGSTYHEKKLIHFIFNFRTIGLVEAWKSVHQDWFTWSIQFGANLWRQQMKDNTPMTFQVCCVMPFGLINAFAIFNIWWMRYFMNTWMILWFITSMTSWKWKTMNNTYVLFWTTLGKFDFTSNWKCVNFIKLKWSYWATSVLKMAFTRVPKYFTLDDVFSQLGEDYPFHLTNFIFLKKFMLKLIIRFLT